MWDMNRDRRPVEQVKSGLRIVGKMLVALAIAVTFMAGCASLNLAAYNYWASSGPLTPHPEIYRMRGNIVFGIGCVLFAAFGVCIWSLNRRKRRNTPRPPLGSQ
jgi:uncharacterized membrane protein YphA (DoxX/SURF4 family)